MLNILKIIAIIVVVVLVLFVSLFVFCAGLLSNILDKEDKEDRK